MDKKTLETLRLLDMRGRDCAFGLECTSYNLHSKLCTSQDNLDKYRYCNEYCFFYEKYVDEN